jgi:hypothetical protein
MDLVVVLFKITHGENRKFHARWAQPIYPAYLITFDQEGRINHNGPFRALQISSAGLYSDGYTSFYGMA